MAALDNGYFVSGLNVTMTISLFAVYLPKCVGQQSFSQIFSSASSMALEMAMSVCWSVGPLLKSRLRHLNMKSYENAMEFFLQAFMVPRR